MKIYDALISIPISLNDSSKPNSFSQHPESHVSEQYIQETDWHSLRASHFVIEIGFLALPTRSQNHHTRPLRAASHQRLEHESLHLTYMLTTTSPVRSGMERRIKPSLHFKRPLFYFTPCIMRFKIGVIKTSTTPATTGSNASNKKKPGSPSMKNDISGGSPSSPGLNHVETLAIAAPR